MVFPGIKIIFLRIIDVFSRKSLPPVFLYTSFPVFRFPQCIPNIVRNGKAALM